LLTKDEARRIAANIAKLAELVNPLRLAAHGGGVDELRRRLRYSANNEFLMEKQSIFDNVVGEPESF
jgi:hypothetical protein